MTDKITKQWVRKNFSIEKERKPKRISKGSFELQCGDIHSTLSDGVELEKFIYAMKAEIDEKKVMLDVPDKHQVFLTMEQPGYDPYGDEPYRMHFKFEYDRPETDEEVVLRIQRRENGKKTRKRQKEKERRKKEKRDKEEYARLKKKFEGK